MYTIRYAFVLGLLLPLVGASQAARAQEAVELKPGLKAGDQWSFSNENDIKLDVSFTMPGAPQQQAQQRITETVKGSMSVVRASGGRPTVLKVQYGPETGGAMEMGGQSQPIPSKLAGQTVNVERDELGIITHDARDTSPQEDKMLRGLFESGGAIYPSKPVKVGDAWTADPKAVAQQFQLSPGDAGSVQCTLDSVKTVGGRHVGMVSAVVSVTRNEGGLRTKIDAKGPLQVDVQSGQIISTDLQGTMTMTGTQQAPGPDGQPVAVQLSGKGTVQFRGSAKSLGGDEVVSSDDHPAPAPSPAGQRFDGVFLGNGMRVSFKNAGGQITGEIEMGEQKFPATATVSGDQIAGSFTADGSKFDFTAVQDGATLKLTSDGTTHELKQKVNPLAKPKRPNPLAPGGGGGGGGARMPTSADDAVARPDVVAERMDPAPGEPVNSNNPPPGAGSVLRFRPYTVRDDQIIPGDAVSVLLPADWTVTGGIKWRKHTYFPAYFDMEVRAPDGVDALFVLPMIPCCWSATPMFGFPPGSIYAGNLVKQPCDPAQFIQSIVVKHIPRLNDARLLGTEELPDVARAAAEKWRSNDGLHKEARAAKSRFRYVENGVEIDEDVYCGMIYTSSSDTGFTFFHPDVFFSFRARAGELDEQARVLAVIQSSVRPNLNWFNRLAQITAILHQQGMDAIREVGELSKIYAQTSAQVSDTITKSYWDRQASQARINNSFSNTIRGVEQYKDPQGYEYQLPSGYDHAWVSNRGEVLVSNEAGFDPGVATQENWNKLQRQ